MRNIIKSIGSIILLFGLSGFILPLIQRDPPFWDSLGNDAPMFAGVCTAVGIVITILTIVIRKKKKG